MNVEDKVIVITGAGRGLGRAIAQTLAANAARLALVDINEESLTQAGAACQDAGAQTRTYPVDVTDERAVEQLFNDVAGDFGQIDGLVNNAGVTRDALLVKVKDGNVTGKMSSEDWDTVMAVDLRSVFLCTREAVVKMIERGSAERAPGGSGLIVNISSISRAGNIGQTNYAAAKAGVVAMTTTWAGELARHGIRVAAVAPGFCNTRLVANMKENMRERLKEKIPLKRLGDPDEIGQTVLFIFQNEFVHGRVIEVDGGMRL
ncbi:SDR family oxidoreductase [Salinisphaera sp.]|uniref:SDR family oxidoreductase n=1 Tax=Salinisphaera sp. TaxID=1914330 RepID=UPI002D79A18C|nr:SDR family oxidoreductase [Salinisphaera sp.]HET7313951.1 SDR family oxidoreductase [Salinisphaera sp.]